MASPGEVKVRESLFSASSEQTYVVNGSDTRSGGGEPPSQNPGRLPQCRQDRPSNDSVAIAGKRGPSPAGRNWGRGRPWPSRFALKSRLARRAIIQAPWISPVAAHHLAASQVRDEDKRYESDIRTNLTSISIVSVPKYVTHFRNGSSFESLARCVCKPATDWPYVRQSAAIHYALYRVFQCYSLNFTSGANAHIVFRAKYRTYNTRTTYQVQ